MRVPRGLTYNIDDPPILLLPHDGEHRLNHEEKAEHLVAQLPFQNLCCGCVHGTAQVSSGIVDENVYPPKRLVGSGNKLLHFHCVGNVSRDPKNATFSRIVFAL